MKKEIAIDKLIEYSDKCVNMYDLCEKIGIKNIGGNNYKEVRKLANELGIELKFSYKKNYYTNRTLSVKKIDMSEILVENSTYKNGNSLKRRLISEGYKENRCECCGIDSWNGKEISLQLHHVNGNHSDNRIENLQILCPNCHSQTETYAGKNSNKENITTNLVKNRKMDASEWSNIKKELWNRNHPSLETLINVFKIKKSFCGVAKVYGVSDKSIVKWFKHYGLPSRKNELKKYIEENKL